MSRENRNIIFSAIFRRVTAGDHDRLDPRVNRVPEDVDIESHVTGTGIADFLAGNGEIKGNSGNLLFR